LSFSILHAGFGLVIVIGAAFLLVQSIQSRVTSLIVTSSLGALGGLVAGFDGGSFLNYHQDFSSMIMASGFSVAVVA
jgi:hypothetical protein